MSFTSQAGEDNLELNVSIDGIVARKGAPSFARFEICARTERMPFELLLRYLSILMAYADYSSTD